ncbi:hypothetical protein ACD591_14705 [Rufibacter glacialis]|uniref:Uncharacterized protein n=1 Tax=Rufibacter glacialis TaxID=1259555 RepID=A0A5M8QNK2_9BACT|nr:hypothetical protein [Rufibacter glacialis]KAA6437787.1 hypothetical protein FOE74_04620 [Rufibacter glacialis]GGK56236.1 hypothetical protein GCM10011405_00490 [Rufibacter glacialis]
MGKKDGKDKNTSPKETEEEKILRQLRKPLKKALNHFGPEATSEKVQALLHSLVKDGELKEAKARIEKEAKIAKKAIDKEAKKAFAALANGPLPSPGSPQENQPEAPSQKPVSSTQQEPPQAPAPAGNPVPAAEASPARPKAGRTKTAPLPPTGEATAQG